MPSVQDTGPAQDKGPALDKELERVFGGTAGV
jgi:hypothetical protein